MRLKWRKFINKGAFLSFRKKRIFLSEINILTWYNIIEVKVERTSLDWDSKDPGQRLKVPYYILPLDHYSIIELGNKYLRVITSEQSERSFDLT